MAALGAREVVLSDSEPSLVELMSQSVRVNQFSGRVRVLRHDWAVDSPAALGRDFDVVIACDCIYYGGDGLPETMKSCCAADGIGLLAHEPRGQVWGQAPVSIEFEKHFQIENMCVDGLHGRPDRESCRSAEDESTWQKWLDHPTHQFIKQQGHLVHERVQCLCLKPTRTSENNGHAEE